MTFERRDWVAPRQMRCYPIFKGIHEVLSAFFKSFACCPQSFKLWNLPVKWLWVIDDLVSRLIHCSLNVLSKHQWIIIFDEIKTFSRKVQTAASGPGRSGLVALSSSMRALGRAPRMGTRVCVVWRPGSWSGRDHGFRAKAESREVLMSEGQFFPWPSDRALVPFPSKGHPGRQPPSARRARLLVKRLCQVGRNGLHCGRRQSPTGRSLRGRRPWDRAVRAGCAIIFRASARAGSRMGARACM